MTRILSREAVSALATGRRESLLREDMAVWREALGAALTGQRVLVIGGAGSIGAATVAELAAFSVAALHVVDINENGLAELVRDLRGRPEGLVVRDFRTLPMDFGAPVMRRFLREQDPYGFVLNFAAVKHVRSEKDAYSLLHMLDTNILKALLLLEWLAERGGTHRYFCVSTDKAANPVNLMGASKRLMEHMIFSHRPGSARARIGVTSARFANVAFSAGSLLDGWLQRLDKRQPLAVPQATRRYFLSLREAGQLCLLAATCAPDGHIVIPRLQEDHHMVDLEGIARALLREVGFEPVDFTDEVLARGAVATEVARDRYPLLLTPLDTSGEKAFEEFIGAGEHPVELGLPHLLAVSYLGTAPEALESFVRWLTPRIAGAGALPEKGEFVREVGRVVPEFAHVETHRTLDDRM